MPYRYGVSISCCCFDMSKICLAYDLRKSLTLNKIEKIYYCLVKFILKKTLSYPFQLLSMF